VVEEPDGVEILARLKNQCGWPGRLMTILAALSLLSMPVDYKGGAELAHAHGLFQFWLPGGHAEINLQDHHHGHQTDRDARKSGARHADEATAGAKVDPLPDRPSLSEMGTPAEKASGIAVSLLLAILAIAATRQSFLRSPTQRLKGLVPLPELPPPRNLLLAST